jgi:hypothetical protein
LTWRVLLRPVAPMSALGQKQTFALQKGMSQPPNADMRSLVVCRDIHGIPSCDDWIGAMLTTAAILAPSKNLIDARFSSGRRCVVRENVVAIFGRLVAGEAGVVQRLVARFAILEVGKSPAASRGVLL